MDPLNQKITNKKVNAEKEGLRFELTKEDIEALLDDAKIKAENWSLTGYHLARFGDSGDYVRGNCRFVHYLENYAERKLSRKSREASSKKMREHLLSLSTEDRKQRAAKAARTRKIKGTDTGGSNKLSDEELIRRFEMVKHLPIQRGFLVKAAKILGCQQQYVGRLLRKWKKMGLVT